MGYSISIGQLEVNINEDGLDSYISLDVASRALSGAPAYGEPTDHMNSRWPSYTSWSDSMNFLGLQDFMFDQDTGLMREHPGTFPLTPDHKSILDEAYTDFYLKYPNAKAGYNDEDENWPEENGYACRLEWLKFWIDWALANCDKPVFHNS